jgi:NTE family protein
MRALVLSGGGSKGAYELGALEHLCGDLGRSYDAVCGVSVGAINAAFLCQYEVGLDALAVHDLGNLWETMGSTVYKEWFGGLLATLWKPSVYNSAPLRMRIKSVISTKRVNSSGRKLRIGATCLDDGQYRVFDETYSDIPTAVLASSAFPAMLTPVELEGKLWSDGGVRDITPLGSAIELGADVIDVIVCSPELPGNFRKAPRAIDIAMRAIDLMSDEINDNDLSLAKMNNSVDGKRIVKINVIRPVTNLIDNCLDFSPSEIKRMRAVGLEDAKRLVGV